MISLKEQKLYRVEIVKQCPVVKNFLDIFFNSKTYLPSPDSFKRGKFGFIPVGTKGWIIKKWGKLWFFPDEKQEGLDLFLSSGQDCVLISYNKIKNYYKEVK